MSETSIGFLSLSKLNFKYLDQEIWLGETPGKSNPSLTLGLKNPKILKLIILVDSLYVEIGEGLGVEYTFLMYTVSKFHPHTQYILGDMIPPS